jgi:ATP-dependent Clp protease ATP-binding subunit ClpA
MLSMFERFTNLARHTVVLAQEEARRLKHNYIGTEHILLGLLGEPEGTGCRALQRFGVSLEGARLAVTEIIGIGKSELSGHIPFTPRAKKVLELAFREAVQLGHNYIGTEHILLGLLREDEGVGVSVLKQHGDVRTLRAMVLELVPAASTPGPRSRSWLWRRVEAILGEHGSVTLSGERSEQTALNATPAADTTLGEAARLAAGQAVGSHHLLLAALADADTAAAKALVALGVDLEQVKEALRNADVTGTSDELHEEAGRRQMVIHVTGEGLTIEARDAAIIEAGRDALKAVGDQADPPGAIRGDLPVAASLSTVWQALHDSLREIQRRATLPDQSPEGSGKPDAPGSEAA